MTDVELEQLKAAFAHQIESWKAENQRGLEAWRAETMQQLEAWKNDMTFRLEGLRIATAMAQQAIRAAFLINGGGAAALLAFIGHASPLALRAHTTLVLATLIFTGGVALASVATLLAFVAQERLGIPQSPADVASGKSYRGAAFATGIGALAAFMAACLVAACGLLIA